MREPSKKPAIAYNPNAKDIYADGALGWRLFNGNVRITLATERVSFEDAGKRVFVESGRIILPLAAAEQMCRSLLTFIENMKSSNDGAGGPTLN